MFTPARVICFGPFAVDVVRRDLRRSGATVEIGAKAFDLLVHFLQRPGTLISGPDLIRAVWHGRAIEANNLTVQLSHLRRALGEAPGGASGDPYIRTVAKSGYVFTPAVSIVGQAPVATSPADQAVELDWLGSSEPAGPFIGRSAELAELCHRLRHHRLVTISGMGGVGKTRLAFRVAARWSGDGGGRVVAVDLAPLAENSDSRRVAEAVAAVLGGSGDAVTERSVVPVLRRCRTLLLLDNAEHVAEAIRLFVQPLLSAAPDVSVLVTSRGTVGVDGESVLRLMPSPVPEQPELLSAAEAMAFESVQIFVALATLQVPGFTFDDTVAPHVASICRRLDGIALAINMVVPRLQVLAPNQLSERLIQHFAGLTTSVRDVPPRQRTLKAMFDWSWALLTPPDRDVLQYTALFSGGASLGLLVAMAARDGHSEWDTLSALVRLVEHSLVIPDLDGQEPRYGLLETTRVFTLSQAGDLLPALRTAHAVQVLALMQRAEAEWPTLHGAQWLDRYGQEVSNLRAAVTWALDGSHFDLALRLVAYAYPLWWERPGVLLRDGQAWLEVVMGRVGEDTPPEIAARLWFSDGWRDARMSDIWNLDKAMRAVSLFRSVNDRMGQGSALWRAGCAAMTPDTIDLSEKLFTEAEALLRTQPTSKWLALCLGKRADILARRGETEAALACSQEALEIVRETGYDYGLMTVGSNMTDMLFTLGQPERALQHIEHVVGQLRHNITAPAIATQAAHQLLAGQAEAALQTARRSAAQALTLGLTGPLAWAAETVALIEACNRRVDRAARLAGFAQRVHPATPFRYGARSEVFRRLKDALSTALPPDRLRALMDEGASWTDEQAGNAVAECVG